MPLFAWSGAATSDGFTVACKIDGPSNVRLAVDTDDAFSDPTFSPQVDGADGWVKISIEGLNPETVYHWRVEEDSVLQASPQGRCETFPVEGAAKSFTFAAASCASTGSNAITFEYILDKQPSFMVHMGDMHYEDIDVDDPALFRAAYELVLGSARQSDLYQQAPLSYMWDDHDYGPNNSDSTAPGRPAALATYREVVPHYPIPFDGPDDDTPISQTFVYGRVRFVTLDLRSEALLYSDPVGEGQLLGVEQLAWLLEIIQSFTEHLLIINVALPWIIKDGDPDERQTDNWGHAAGERQAICDAIQQFARGRVLLIHGDSHMIAMDDGTNTNFASDPQGLGPPLLCLAPMDRTGSMKGGPYSQGTYTQVGSQSMQYGTVEVEDSGNELTVTARGFDADANDAEVMQLSFVVPEPDPELVVWRDGQWFGASVFQVGTGYRGIDALALGESATLDS